MSAGPLAGITRELILEWYEVEERDITLAEALAADEVFLTSSLRDIQPVRGWDEVDFELTHPVTDEIAATFAATWKAEIDP